MNKRTLNTLSLLGLAPVALMIAASMPLSVHAADKRINYVELFKTDHEAYLRAITCTDDQSIEDGCYSDFNGINKLNDAAVTRGASKEVVNKYKKQKSETKQSYAGSQSKYITDSKGYVFGGDELHVTGLPADPETGYTLPGDYTDVPIDSDGTDVYGQDDLHVIGTPTRPDGYSAAGRYLTSYYSGSSKKAKDEDDFYTDWGAYNGY